MGAFSVIWGLLPWAVPGSGSLESSALLMIFLLGLANVGVPSLTAYMPSARAFVVPMTLGLASSLAWQATVLGGFLAATCLLNLAITLHYAQAQHKAMRSVQRSRWDNEALAEHLSQQIALVQRASEEKTRFMAAASHDMRQPLHAVALFGAVLERELAEHAQGGNARDLMKALRALTDSLDTMLDISQLDAGTLAVRTEAVALHPLLLALDSVFSSRAEQKGLELRLRPNTLWVRSDGVLLLRILTNLVDNAIKYTDRGGVLVTVRQRTDLVWLDVVDTGVGIAAADTEHIFDEFFQVNNPERNRARGLGVGLAVVRRLAQLLSHAIELVSRPGRGSRFRLCLPLCTAPQAAPLLPTATTAQALGLLPRRVLLIDDEADIATAMAALMRSWGIDLVCVGDETQARAAMSGANADQAPFQAIVCDVRLAHGADGLALAQSLREQVPAGLVCQTVLITGETHPDALLRIRATGLPTLFKPVNAETLLQVLRQSTD